MSRSRSYVFTLPNYTSDEVERLQTRSDQVRYLVYGCEVAPTTGTAHLQGFVYFYNAKTLKQAKVFLGERYHLEVAKGSVPQNVAYCTKDGNVFSYGEPPSQGARNDIASVKEQIASGVRLGEIVRSATSYQSARHAELLMKYQPAPPSKERDIRWYWGPSGTGKTRLAMEEAGSDYWISSRTLKWWDGYDGQRTVIIDDFREDMCPYRELLRLLDRYPVRVEVKGGSLWLQPSTEVIIITSPYPPNEIYHNSEEVLQLFRRIKVVKRFQNAVPSSQDVASSPSSSCSSSSPSC